MSKFSRSAWCLLTASVTFGVVACIDAPQMNGGVAGASASNDPAGAGGSGGASAVSSDHEGMVLVPAVTLAVATGVAPTAVVPQGKDGGGGNGDAKPPKGGGKGGGGSDGGGGGGAAVDAGSAGTPSTGSGTPAATTTQVAVPEFWLDAVEVTVASYRACLASGSCTVPGTGAGCTLAAGLDAHPVNCVSVDQARAFCTWSEKRLVRNDEWSAATAGSARRLYPWGAELPDAARLNACGAECATPGMYATSDPFVATAPTGSFPLGRSPDGADDLAGNVAEWVDATLVPLARGGSYADVDASRVTAASIGFAATSGPTVGFRCAADH